ncbi:MAG: serine hydrolase domain-containing protein [Vicinamibacterales bacterium]
MVGGVLFSPDPPSLSMTVTGDAALAESVRPYLAGALDRVSVATIDEGDVTYAGFGADEHTQYEIGSITKTFTALLFVDAVSRGEVTEDTRLGTLLPLEGARVADVTLAELASHRSGLSKEGLRLQDAPLLVPLFLHKDPFRQDVDRVVAHARKADLRNRGEVAYSNLGYALLGQGLAAASGMDYSELVRARIFEPLGMTESSVPTTPGYLSADAPTGYDSAGKAEAAWTMNAWAPAGGIRSTTSDMARYARALLDGTAPGMAALTPRWDYYHDGRMGYGWVTGGQGRETLTWHNGRNWRLREHSYSRSR